MPPLGPRLTEIEKEPKFLTPEEVEMRDLIYKLEAEAYSRMHLLTPIPKKFRFFTRQEVAVSAVASYMVEDHMIMKAWLEHRGEPTLYSDLEEQVKLKTQRFYTSTEGERPLEDAKTRVTTARVSVIDRVNGRSFMEGIAYGEIRSSRGGQLFETKREFNLEQQLDIIQNVTEPLDLIQAVSAAQALETVPKQAAIER